MGGRRPEPEGFTEDMDLLLSLQQRRADLEEEIDEVFLRLAVEKRAPTTTIAEHLNVSAPTVSVRRTAALRRRERRQQERAATRNQAA
jgi:hypothetical protein